MSKLIKALRRRMISIIIVGILGNNVLLRRCLTIRKYNLLLELEEPEVESLPQSHEHEAKQEETATTKTNKCSHHPVLNNVTLTGGIRAGKFTSQGHVDTMDDCIERCCDRDDCDLAFMVKNTCFSLRCLDDKLCKSKPAKPSPYHPMVAYMTRYKPQNPSK